MLADLHSCGWLQLVDATLYLYIKRWSVKNGIPNANKIYISTKGWDMGSLEAWRVHELDRSSIWPTFLIYLQAVITYRWYTSCPTKQISSGVDTFRAWRDLTRDCRVSILAIYHGSWDDHHRRSVVKLCVMVVMIVIVQHGLINRHGIARSDQNPVNWFSIQC